MAYVIKCHYNLILLAGITVAQKSNNKIFFHAVSYSSLLVMIYDLLVTQEKSIKIHEWETYFS